MYDVDTNKVLRILKKRKEQFKKDNNGQIPKFFRFITEDNSDNTVEIDAVINSPLSFLYDSISNYSDRADSLKRISFPELFELDESDKGENDTHKNPNEKSKYSLRGCKSLLLVCLLYGNNRRLLSKVKSSEDYRPEDLVYYKEDPDSCEFFDIDYIYGYSHIKVYWG